MRLQKITALTLLVLSGPVFAAPIFNITTTQHTMTLNAGSSSTLTYTITNNTNATLTNIQYFPPPLTALSNTGTTCGTSLTSHASCTLNLTVTAPNTPGRVLLGPLSVCSKKVNCSAPSNANRTTLIITAGPGPEFYVLDYDGNTVKVLDVNSNTITHTITVQTAPRAMVFNSTGTRAYVANQTSNSISVIDTSNYTVLSTITGVTNPRKLVIMPDDSKIYVQQDSKTGAILVVDLNSETVSSISITNGSVDIALKPDGSTLYSLGNVTSTLPASLPLFPITTSTDTVGTSITLTSGQSALPTFLNSARIACSPDGTFLVLSGGVIGANTFKQSLTFVNLSNNVVTVKTPVNTGFGGTPQTSEASIAITSDSLKVLAGSFATSAIATAATSVLRNFLYDVFTASYIGSAPVSDGDWTVSTVVNATLNTKIYTPNTAAANTIGIISATTGNAAGTLTLGTFTAPLNYMAFTSDGLHAYVTNRGGNVIYYVDTSTDTLTSTISTDVGAGPSTIVRKPSS